MEDFDIVVIGAGVVGLAVAERLASPDYELLVLEQHESFGKETSSRNSEVIHAGFYYETGSLKARLCVEGNFMMYRFCRENQVPFRKTGKLLISNTDEEEERSVNFTIGGTETVSGDLSFWIRTRFIHLNRT